MAYTISNGDTSSGIILKNDSMTVLDGGTVNHTTVNEDGDLYVLRGGTANNTKLNYCGNMYISSGGTANSNTINRYGFMWLFSGGTADNTTVNSEGSLVISFGGTANSTTVNSSGCLYVSSGGTANNTTVNEGSEIYVESGGTATVAFTPWQQGSIFSENGADITYLERDANVYYGKNSMFVSKADNMDSLLLSSGCSIIVYSAGTANSTTIDYGGSMVVLSGGTANSTTLDDDAGDFIVSSGGIANNTTVKLWGHFYVSSGGTANSTTVNPGGSLYVFSGGRATEIVWTPCEGYVYIENGAVVTFVSQYSGVYYGSCHQLLSHAITMNGKKVGEDFAEMDVMSDGTADNPTVYNSGFIFIYNGGTANSAIVNEDGNLNVHSGGKANSTTINSAGSLFVFRGGTANNTTVNSGGYFCVSSGGTATEITENGGYVDIEDGAKVFFVPNVISGLILSHSCDRATIHSGTTANSTKVNDYCDLIVSSGGIADITIVRGGKLFVSSGGTANDTTVNSSGRLYVSSGGTANRTTVNSKGLLRISNGGTANNTTVNEGSEIYVEGGGKLTGNMMFENGAAVYAYTGAILDFDLTQTSAGAAALVNDLSCVDGTPIYTLTVNGTESSGTYSLVDGVSVFNSVLSVMNTSGEQLGSLMAGQKLETDYADYSLKVANGSLTVTIKASKTPAPDNPAEKFDNGWLYDMKNGLNPDAGNFASTTLEDGVPGIPIDQEGSVSFFREEDGVTYGNHVGKDDETDFAKIELNDPAKLSFVIEATDAAKFSVCSLTPCKTEGTYTMKTLQTTALKKTVKDGVARYTATTKSLLFDKSGTDGMEYYISVQSTNAKKGGSAYYNVTLNEDAEKTFFYSDADDGTNGWLSRNKGKERNADVAIVPGTAITSGTTFVQVDEAETVSREAAIGKDTFTFTNYVGYGDAADYRKITLENGASLSFTVKATDAAKIVICSLVEGTGRKAGTYTMKQLQTSTLKLDKETRLYTVDTKPLLLSLNAEDADGNACGEYYLSVQSTNAAKGGKAYYNVELNDGKTIFYSDADAGMNNWLYRKADKARNMDVVKSEGTAITMGTTNIQIDEEGAVSYTDKTSMITYSNFVGFGDDTDFARIELDADATVSFKVDATDSAKFIIYSLTPGKNGYTMKAVQTTALKLGKDKKPISQTTKALWLADGTYYIAMQSTNAKSGGAAYYNVSLNRDACSGLPDAILESHDACALTMPEPFDMIDDLGVSLMNEMDQISTLSGMGASADIASERIFEESGAGMLASL